MPRCSSGLGPNRIDIEGHGPVLADNSSVGSTLILVVSQHGSIVMKTKYAPSTLLHYEGPDSDYDDITEDQFRGAIAYLVAIQPSEASTDGLESYKKAMAPYQSYIGRANRTLARYATQLHWVGPEAMQNCFYQYAEDPSFFREDLPRSTVRSLLRLAWAGEWQY